ncbi:hypothetical protein Tco_0622603 [Tanacetum coccineum]
MNKVAKTIGLIDAIAKINDPQCELLRLRSYTGISRLYFIMRTCPPRVFESAQRSIGVALCSFLERIFTAFGPEFSDCLLACRLSFFGILVLFLRGLFSMIRPYGLLKGTSDWLRTVPISRLGQTMKACSRVFVRDIYRDHVVSCAVIIGIKHRHKVVRDTHVDICYRSGISAGKKIDIGLDGGHHKPLRLADMLLYSYWIWVSSLFFSSLGELEADAVTLLKRIRKFSMTQDIGTRAAAHIFNKISFAIAKRGFSVNLLVLGVCPTLLVDGVCSSVNMFVLVPVLTPVGLAFWFSGGFCFSVNVGVVTPVTPRSVATSESSRHS